jgi:hypothetical protein
MHDQLKITVIATGFDQTKAKLREFIPSSQARMNQVNNLQQSPTPPVASRIVREEPEKQEDEDVWDIPAFLRQKN